MKKLYLILPSILIYSNLFSQDIKLNRNYFESNVGYENNYAVSMNNKIVVHYSTESLQNTDKVPIMDFSKLCLNLDILNPVKTVSVFKSTDLNDYKYLNEDWFDYIYKNGKTQVDPSVYIPVYNNTGDKIYYKFIEKPIRNNRIRVFRKKVIGRGFYYDAVCETPDKWYTIKPGESKYFNFHWVLSMNAYSEGCTDYTNSATVEKTRIIKRFSYNYGSGLIRDSIGVVIKCKKRIDTNYIKLSGIILSESELNKIIADNKARFLGFKQQQHLQDSIKTHQTEVSQQQQNPSENVNTENALALGAAALIVGTVVNAIGNAFSGAPSSGYHPSGSSSSNSNSSSCYEYLDREKVSFSDGDILGYKIKCSFGGIHVIFFRDGWREPGIIGDPKVSGVENNDPWEIVAKKSCFCK